MSDSKQWQEVGGKPVKPRIITEQREALIRLRDILQGVVTQEQDNLATVREQMHRMKHGGGS